MNRKFLITLLFIALGTFTSSAQVGINLGVKTGVNYSGFTGGIRTEFGVLGDLDMHYGVIADFKFSDKISIQPEILYSSRNGQANTKPGDDRRFSFVTNRSYIDIPVNFKYALFSKFYIEVGPQISFLATEDNVVTFYDNTSEKLIDSFDSSSTDLSANIGFSFAPINKLLFQLRLNTGFTKVVETFHSKNSMLSLSVAYNFLNI